MISVSASLKYQILTATTGPESPRPSGRVMPPPPKIEKPEAKHHGRPAIKQQTQNPVCLLIMGIGD